MSYKTDLFWYWSANCGQSRVLTWFCSKWGRPCGSVSTSWQGQRHGWVPDLPSYVLATCVLFSLPHISTQTVSFFSADPRYQQVTDTGQVHVTLISIHSCGLTREGVETNLAHAYITTGRGGQVKLVIIRGLLCKERNTLNTSKKYDSGLVLLLACRVQSVQSYAVTQVRSKLASTRTLSRKTAR